MQRQPPRLFLNPGLWDFTEMGEHHLLMQNKCLTHEFAYPGQFLLIKFQGYHICRPNPWHPVGSLVKRFNCCQLSISELERWNVDGDEMAI